MAQLRDRIERHEEGTPQYHRGFWRQAFNAVSYKKFFQEPEEKVWSYELPVTQEIAINRAMSKSYISILPDNEKQQVQTDLEAIVQRGDGLVWLDESKGIFEYPYETLMVIARKK